ncbi:MAG: S4 domain-containing protein YaaA [Xenococcaceae cyanobacterium MO_207.B15]|nr:S4 domain-containing protein YaaA [Xenococcaceae cyanobacterium MO_207.B15]MDJ0743830.1 S4 domain-containing protein YaaA [Xenococcaceae cyanobacterium MO_167.B27]
MNNQQSTINKDYIKLDQFLKWQGIVQTGGEAKIRIKQGEVVVNGEVETRRGKKLRTGDRVSLGGVNYDVQLD